MRILQLYNQYRSLCGGEECVVYDIMAILKKRGVQTRLDMRTSRGLERSLAGKIRAFWNGIYSISSYNEMVNVIKEEKPDIVHVHNLYPLFSPSVLVACRKNGIPTVMNIHNFALTCPNTCHLYKERVCDRCLGGHEYWCVIRNCTGIIFKSFGYALRSAVARKFRLFHDNVTIFIALTEFARRRLVEAGSPEERIVVVPNMVSIPDSAIDPSKGRYAAFAGRMSPEKGVDTLFAAATKLPEIPVRIAGDGPIINELVGKAPENVEFTGLLDTQKMAAFYQNARFILLPSMWFEGCPMVILEAMSHGLPVIASRIGGIPELVDDGVTGFLFEPGNAKELAEKMKLLWDNPDLCRQMGKAGREKAIREYSEDVYYKRLMAVYKKATEIGKDKSQECVR